MNSSPNDNERIQDYLDNTMSDTERQRFEADCVNNPTLSRELKIYDRVQQALKNTAARDFRHQLDQLIQDHKKEVNPSTKPNNFRLLGLAGLFIFIMGFGVYKWYNGITVGKTIPKSAEDQQFISPADTAKTLIPPTPSETEPVAQHPPVSVPQQPSHPALPKQQAVKSANLSSENNEYQALAIAEYQKSSFVFRNVSANTPMNTSQQALEYFAMANDNNLKEEAVKRAYLEKAIEILDTLPANSNDALLFTRAQAYFQIANYELSAKYFGELTSSFIYGYDADWGQLLCYLAQMPKAQNNYEKKSAEITANTAHSFRTKALSLSSKVALIK